MKRISEILRSDFQIVKIAIENFTLLHHEVIIRIEIHSKEFGNEVIIFENVSGVNINADYYFCSENSSILIEDISSAQMEDINYNVTISEDAMSFYCKDISID